jgi:HD-GYP domain-containing protein (c-di-GMP phosphodiesterase class II)
MAVPQEKTSESAQLRFCPVFLGCLQTEHFAPCDLFLKTGDDHYTLFAKEGIPFDLTNRDNLLAYGVPWLYIKNESTPLYFKYMRERLVTVVRDSRIPDKQKAMVVHASCKDILSRVFQDPRANFIEQAHAIVSPTVNLIVSNDNATRYLVQITGHDHSTYVHSTNVGIFSVALAKIFYGKNADCDIQRMGAGFFLHDIGKCKIPLGILNKPGPLTPEEWALMKQHPENGYRMLSETGRMTEEAGVIILQHHEKDDGSGYPKKLTSEMIHPYARICRLADVFEALTSVRPYHKPRSAFKALKEMKEKILVDMDTALFEHFVRLFKR